MHPFEVYGSAVFHIVTQLCHRHRCLIREHSCHPQRNPTLVTVESSALGDHSFTSCLCDFDSTSYERNPASVVVSDCFHSASRFRGSPSSLHASLRYSFLLQVIEMPPCVYPFINWWRFGLFLFLLLWIILLWTIVHKILRGRVFPCLAGLELAVES